MRSGGEMQPGTEEYTERSSIRSAFSSDLPPPPQPPPDNPLHRAAAWAGAVPKRYIVAFMAFLGFCNIYALRVNLSVAIVAMVSSRVETYNGTTVTVSEFDWDSRTQGLILGSFFYGYIVTQLPGGWLANQLGGKYLFGGGILGTAVLTIITPPAARFSKYCLIAVRVLEGLFEGVTYPCIHAIWAKWAPPLERSRLATIAFSGSYAGTVIALPLSGAIANEIGWPWVFYVFGLIGVLWYCLWLYIVSESPAEHPTISNAELEYIQSSIGFTDQQVKGYKVPWKDILTSLPVWAVIMAHFAENWGFYTFLTELPMFLYDILHYDLSKAGFVAALPYLAMAIVVQLGGHMADYLRRTGILSTTNTRKVTTSGAFLFQMIFLVITAYVMTPIASIACITIAVGVGGFAWAGFPVNHLDIAPQYASVLMGLSNMFATIPGIVSPNLTGAIVQNKTADEWRVVFYIAAAIYCVGAVVYAVFAVGEKQQWAEVPVGYQSHIDNTAETTTDHEDLR